MKDGKLSIHKLLLQFLKDQLWHTLCYALGCSAIILFYQIMTEHTLEVQYPIGLAVGVYLFYLIGSFLLFTITTKRFLRMLHHSARCDEFYLERDKKIAEIINQIHHNYTMEMMNAKEDRQTELNMISAWVHSMKTPVTVTDLILQRVRNGECSLPEVATNLQTENNKILNLLDNILNMIRLQEFEKDYIPQVIDLNEQVQALINVNKSLFIQSRVFPKFESTKEPVMVLADTKWNRIMLQQIISNAVKYSKTDSEDARYIKFALAVINSDHGKIAELQIKDHGIGIPDYDISRVFDLFFTGENGRKIEQSSGIGLYFAKEICRMFGAQIFIDSKLGEGTSVTIRYLAKS